jgi:protein-tyrosine phosphatase
MAQLERLRDGAHAQASTSQQPYEYARCNTEEHAPRNRYANVDINASPIVLVTTQSETPLQYIATQVRLHIAQSWVLVDMVPGSKIR